MAVTILSESYGPRKPFITCEADSLDDLAGLVCAEGSTATVGGTEYVLDRVNGWVVPGSGGGGGDDAFVVTAKISDQGIVTYDNTASDTMAAIEAGKYVSMIVEDRFGVSHRLFNLGYGANAHLTGYFFAELGSNMQSGFDWVFAAGYSGWDYINAGAMNIQACLGVFPTTAVAAGNYDNNVMLAPRGDGVIVWSYIESELDFGNNLETLIQGAMLAASGGTKATLDTEVQDDGSLFGVVANCYKDINTGRGTFLRMSVGDTTIITRLQNALQISSVGSERYVAVFSGAFGVQGSASAYSYYDCKLVLDAKYVEAQEEYSIIGTITCEEINATQA